MDYASLLSEVLALSKRLRAIESPLTQAERFYWLNAAERLEMDIRAKKVPSVQTNISDGGVLKRRNELQAKVSEFEARSYLPQKLRRKD
jgi:hypothetical protein